VSEQLGFRGKFVVSYFGTHGMAHGWKLSYGHAQELRDQTDIFPPVGGGADRKGF